ncbi:beta family protein [Amycolatopsis thermoflava]|uniref:beta family protein n=1 Tax=Amycolatopsis thermoflava TaxID=84480 RepID=UPI003D71B7D5
MSSVRAHYVPILVTKRGELGAIDDLPAETKDKFTPLFVAHPVDWNYETDAPAKSVVDHVRGLGQKLARVFEFRRAYFDPALLVEDAEWEEARSHPLVTVIDEAANNGLQLVPVVAPGRHPSYNQALTQVHQSHDLGVCIRLSPIHWPANPPAVSELEKLLADLSLEPNQVDLVLDAGGDVENEAVRALAFAALANLPFAQDWRSLVLSGGPFPKDLSAFSRNTVSRISRLEWDLWRDVESEARVEGWRLPDFGDYGVAHPDPRVMVDPRFLNISAAIRYTASSHWLAAKGDLFKGRGGSGSGGDAIVPVAQMIVEAPEYCGPSYSVGDAWISNVARGLTSGGNPEKWRRIATNHHLVFVTESLANSGETSVST